MAELTAKQQRFVDEYCIDLNATQAAIRAGYSEKTAYSIGQENLKKPEIAAAIEKKRKRLEIKTEITAEWVINQFAENHRLAREIGELQASNKALEMIGKHLGLFTDKVKMDANVTGEMGLTVIFDKEMGA